MASKQPQQRYEIGMVGLGVMARNPRGEHGRPRLCGGRL